jgi:hypothetical protein
MARILDLSVELIARIFEEMEMGDAWIAREVCRDWRKIFEFVALQSTSNVHLQNVEVGIGVICRIASSKGETLDRHVVHGQLTDSSNRGGMQQIQWIPEEKSEEVWPGGRWRKYSIGDLLTDVHLHFSNMPSNSPDLYLRLGADVSIAGRIDCREGTTVYVEEGIGKFKDFCISINTHDEVSPHGKFYKKHCITGLSAPLLQIYSLFVHHINSEREKAERIRRHYARSSSFVLLHEVAERQLSTGFGGEWV